jgi:hypothetical protein
VHPDVPGAPAAPALCAVPVPVAPELVAPPGEVPVLAGLPVPSVLEPPDDCPPVSTFELT